MTEKTKLFVKTCANCTHGETGDPRIKGSDMLFLCSFNGEFVSRMWLFRSEKAEVCEGWKQKQWKTK